MFYIILSAFFTIAEMGMNASLYFCYQEYLIAELCEIV